VPLLAVFFHVGEPEREIWEGRVAIETYIGDTTVGLEILVNMSPVRLGQFPSQKSSADSDETGAYPQSLSFMPRFSMTLPHHSQVNRPLSV
jgi:hypothetical protein